ncbi:MAG: Mrp/NBP35 family ATP-binding protein [Propionibacteriaceae bacterium]|jgi:ATP-binding protein involved in chromosome partitioning|nr:Mrp/NBP35 family ATP-binding protein [Propionibacteriaceae bacterium]
MNRVVSAVRAAVLAALATVEDPELRRPITELNMVDSVAVSDTGRVQVRILLTVAGCPLRDVLEQRIGDALAQIAGVSELRVEIGVMSDEQRDTLFTRLRGTSSDERATNNPFNAPDCATTVLAVASGKGGVGKSSVTVNLAVALSRLGFRVGLLDADIYGHSVPDMLAIGDQQPNVVSGVIMPVSAYGVTVMSIAMMKESRSQVIAWRGPMLDRALQQFLSDVYWGELDYLLVDLPPGTGDVAMSVAQLLPSSKVLVVTTPQVAAAEVAERAGTMAFMLKQDVIGVVENMSWLETNCQHCGAAQRVNVFGSGGGSAVTRALSERFGHDVPLLAQIPIDEGLRAGGDTGSPIVLADAPHPAAAALMTLAAHIATWRQALQNR